MTEKDKAKKGMLYNANYDDALLKDRDIAKQKLFKYNNTCPTEYEQRANMIMGLFKKIGKSFLIESTFFCDYGYNISIGENFYANVGCVILDAADVIIGDNVFLAPYVGIYTAGHPINYHERNQGLEYAYPITIGNNVWIGANSAILPNVTIGDNSVIGAGSVVCRDIPPNVVAFGNPCKVFREIEKEV